MAFVPIRIFRFGLRRIGASIAPTNGRVWCVCRSISFDLWKSAKLLWIPHSSFPHFHAFLRSPLVDALSIGHLGSMLDNRVSRIPHILIGSCRTISVLFWHSRGLILPIEARLMQIRHYSAMAFTPGPRDWASRSAGTSSPATTSDWTQKHCNSRPVGLNSVHHVHQ